MARILTVCRIGVGWGFRDATHTEYGHSIDVCDAVKAAERMARHLGGQVVLSAEAEAEIHAPSVRARVHAQGTTPSKFPHRVRAIVTRLTRWRGGK